MASTNELKLLVTAQDRASKVFSGVGKNLDNLKNSLNSVSDKFINFGKVSAVALGGLGVLTAKTGIEFEKMMSSVAAKSGATGDQLQMLEKKARDMASATVFSATETAEAMDFMAMAGLNTTEIMEGLEGMLNLAQAGNLDLATATDIATNVMGQFGMEATELTRIVDVMAKTATSSNTNITEMGEAMKYLGPTMNAIGVSIEETSGLIGVLANNGIKGSLAGRAFGTSLTRLAKPTKQMSGVMRKLNLDFFDAKGEFIGMAPMVKMLETRFSGLTVEQKQSAITTLFGAEALQEVNILLETGSEELQNYTNTLENSEGAGRKMADTMTDNVWGGLKRVSSAFQEVQLKIDDAIGGVIPFQKILDNLAESINKNGPEIAAMFKDIFTAFTNEIGKTDLSGMDFMETLRKVKDAVIKMIPAFVKIGAVIVKLGVFVLENIDTITLLIASFKGIQAVIAGGALATDIYKVGSSLMSFAISNPILAAIAISLGLITASLIEYNQATQELDASLQESGALNDQLNLKYQDKINYLRNSKDANTEETQNEILNLQQKIDKNNELMTELNSDAEELKGIKGIWNSTWQDITNAFTAAKDWIYNKHLELAIWLVAKHEELTNKLNEAWEKIKQFAIDTWTNIKDSITSKVEEMQGVLENKWDYIKNMLLNRWDTIKNVAIDRWNLIKDAIGKAMDWIMDKIQPALDMFDDFKQKAIDAWNTLQDWTSDLDFPGLDTLLSIGQSVLDFFGNLKQTAIDAYNATTQALSVDGKQFGGAVRQGEAVVVGERGQEVFVPSQSGNIKTMDQLSGGGGNNINITVNASTNANPMDIADEIRNLFRQDQQLANLGINLR